MARSSAVIRAEIEATNKKLKEVETEIDNCNQLIALLTQISSDVSACTQNLSFVYYSLERGLTYNGIPEGGEQVNYRKNVLNSFNTLTEEAIEKVQKRLQELEEEASQLRSKLVALNAELAAALAEEAAAAAAAQAQAASRKSIPMCFKKGVKVLTNDGYKDIDTIKVNDIVMSYNLLTNKNEYSKVIKTYEHKDIKEKLYTIISGQITIEATSMHPFGVKIDSKLEFVNAMNLKEGYNLIDYQGNIHKITSILCEEIEDTYYNIEVENNHNYYVTENNILVHNK